MYIFSEYVISNSSLDSQGSFLEPIPGKNLYPREYSRIPFPSYMQPNKVRTNYQVSCHTFQTSRLYRMP